MRIRRPCYDKYHRCPGWAGSGMKYVEYPTCDGGRIQIDYDAPFWKCRMWPCNTCDIWVLPYSLVQFFPANVKWHIRYWWEYGQWREHIRFGAWK